MSGKRARLRRQAERQAVFSRLVSSPFLRQIRASILRSGARPDSCIMSTRVMCDIGEMIGINITPLTVRALVFNRVVADEFRRRGDDEVPDEVIRDLVANKGGWILDVGVREGPTAPGQWAGHLVAVARTAGVDPVVIDLSIDQADRPEKGIKITEPITFPVPPAERAFLRGEQNAMLADRDSGILMVYLAYPGDVSFKDAPDWEREWMEPTTKAFIKSALRG